MLIFDFAAWSQIDNRPSLFCTDISEYYVPGGWAAIGGYLIAAFA